MSHASEPVLRQALHDAASHVRPHPGLLEAARAGGRRRQRLRRGTRWTAVAATAATLAIAGGLAPGPPWRRSDVTPAGIPSPVKELLNRPTTGNLAGDPRYLRQAIDRWTAGTSLGGDHATPGQLGAPHVLWAGDTPAGPAAVVVQVTRPGGATPEASVGIVAPGPDGVPALLGETLYSWSGATRFEADRPTRRDVTFASLTDGIVVAGVFGTRAPTLLVFATRDVSYSEGRTYQPDGTIDRPLTPVNLDRGIATLSLPRTVDTGQLIVTPAPVEDGTPRETIMGQPVGGGYQLPWPETVWALTAGATPKPRSQQEKTLLQALAGGYTDPLAVRIAAGTWYAQGVSPDGREIVVGERQLDNDRSQIYAVLTGANGDRKVAYGGPADASRPLPVTVHLPDRQGWVVAQNTAALRYRTGGGQWHDAGHDAALIPDLPALQVEVTGPGGAPKVVPLH